MLRHELDSYLNKKNRVKLDSYLIMNLMIFRWGRGHTRLPDSEPAQTGLDLPPKKVPTPKRYSVDDIHQQKIEVNSIPTPKALP